MFPFLALRTAQSSPKVSTFFVTDWFALDDNMLDGKQ